MPQFGRAWIRADDKLHDVDDQHKPNWLDELENLGLLRRMDGGFIWFRSDVRQSLRKCFELSQDELIRKPLNSDQPPFRVRKRLEGWDCASQLANVHESLATWYRKVFDATSTVPAIFENIDHLCFSVEYLIRQPAATNHSGGKILGLLDAIREVLREQLFLIQAQGHPRVSVRRLDYIRDFWTKDIELGSQQQTRISNAHLKPSAKAIPLNQMLERLELEEGKAILKGMAKLQLKAVEVAMVLAREIGEEGQAYERMREWAERRLSDEPLRNSEVTRRLDCRYSAEKGTEEDRSRQFAQERLSCALTNKFSQESLERSPTPGDAAPRDASPDSSKPVRTAGSAEEAVAARKGEMIRWWRSCGILATGSRTLRVAEESYFRAIQAAGARNIRYYKGESGDMSLTGKRIREMLAKLNFEQDNSYRVNLEILHTLDSAAFFLILCAQAKMRCFQLCSGEELNLEDRNAQRSNIEREVKKIYAGR